MRLRLELVLLKRSLVKFIFRIVSFEEVFLLELY